MDKAKCLRQKELFSAYIKSAVFDSLIDEVSATPKPGLVDLHDSGAHRDMDYRTFEASTCAIVPYLSKMADTGLFFEGSPEELFAQIRPVGVDAERAMFSATQGVNTHKGMIFSMGLTAAAAGAVFSKNLPADNRTTGAALSCLPENPVNFPADFGDLVLSCASLMCRNPLEAEFNRIRLRGKKSGPGSHGEFLYLTYGCRGIRGEAADGFPAIRTCALPALRLLAKQNHLNPAKPRDNGVLWNRIRLQTLLHLMAEVDDTNVLYRADYGALSYVREQAALLLSQGGSFTPAGMEGLKSLNQDFIDKNLSPGGCADLLAITLFLWRLEQYPGAAAVSAASAAPESSQI